MRVSVNNFSIQQIAESGQCFRINKIADKEYSVIANGEYLKIKQVSDSEIEVSCGSAEWESFWVDYFDLKYDYSKIVDKIESENDDFLKRAVNYGGGIRILRQEPFEMLISFIISQRKNIPAIKSCIQKLCKQFGEKKTFEDIEYYTFPKAEELRSITLVELSELGVGYRATYLKRAVEDTLSGKIVLGDLADCTNDEAITKLKCLYGVGDKVASCISLFGLHHIEAFPIDVWIQRIIDAKYSGVFNVAEYRGYAGIIQQYMFYYILNNKEELET